VLRVHNNSFNGFQKAFYGHFSSNLIRCPTFERRCTCSNIDFSTLYKRDLLGFHQFILALSKRRDENENPAFITVNNTSGSRLESGQMLV